MTLRGLQASKQGIQLAEKALLTKRLKKQDVVGSICYSRQPISRFFNGKHINRDIFYGICDKLGLKLEDIAILEDTDSEAAMANSLVNFTNNQALIPSDSMGTTVGGRYKIIELLGKREYGETYLAEDLGFLHKPQCVVKQLKSQSSQIARRIFDREARVLYKLGKHDRIPNLVAHFKENENFYLVHQFIEGHDLRQELKEGQPWSEPQVITLLKEILEILEFVHQNEVIHRDINPQNLIRRRSDGKIVLTNFGAVKQISTGQTRTFAGTVGYMPPEQGAVSAKLCSDVYTIGIVGIQALTGLHPSQLKVKVDTGDIIWRDKVQVSQSLVSILERMVRYDFKVRYQSAAEALQAFKGIGISE